MQRFDSLSPAQALAVRALADAVTAADGTPPLNEEAHLALSADQAEHWLVRDGATLVGYAQWHPGHGTAQALVHPGHRRQGHGTRLIGAVSAAHPPARCWAFGDLPAARGLADRLGWTPVRGLFRMGRPLTDADARVEHRFRAFTDADAAGFLAVNAAAFAGHPEQGQFSRADLAARQAEPWFDPAGLLLADDDEGVVGFHWTKIVPDQPGPRTGEVYVIGIHPRAAGQGLGRRLLDAGLAHLRRRGCDHVVLYVDADNAPAVRLYEQTGFAIEHTDRLYSPPAQA